MANNYRQFSSQFKLPEGVQKSDVEAWFEEATAEPKEVPAVRPEGAKWDETPGHYLAPWRDENNEYGLSFTAELEDEGIWVYAEESGNVEEAVNLIQTFWEKFGPPDGKETGVISFADTCSKMRLDEFDGGAVAFTRTECRWFTGSYLADRWLERKASNKTRYRKVWAVILDKEGTIEVTTYSKESYATKGGAVAAVELAKHERSFDTDSRAALAKLVAEGMYEEALTLWRETTAKDQDRWTFVYVRQITHYTQVKE